MAKNTNRVASAFAYVAALVLATGAWAAHWEMYSNHPVTYASEIFGGDDPAATGLTLQADDATTTEDGQDEQTSVDLKLYLPNDGSMSVATDSELEVTFSLKGANFGQAVNWTDITVMGTNLEKVGGSQKDGRRNDSSVSLRVTLESGTIAGTGQVGTDDPVAVDTEYAVRFDLGSIIGYGGTGSVTADASFRVTDGPDDNFPTELVARKAVAAVVADDTVDPPIVAAAAIPGTNTMVATSGAAVTFDAADGSVAGQIDLDERGKLDGATKLEVASLSYDTDEEAVEADGKTSFSDGKGAQANIHITVSGMVRDTDTIWFDQDNDSKMGAKESLSITNGVASKSFRLSNVDAAGSSVYFEPDADTPMSAGEIEAMFAVEYDDASAVDPDAEMASVELEYSGITMEARAYAIPNPGMNDIGNVRIKCEADGDSMCTVFLDCNEQDGTPHFEELGSTIAAGATMVLQAGPIAEVLGVDEWAGRLSCDIWSDENVSAQVLVRSAESLINNTYISGD